MQAYAADDHDGWQVATRAGDAMIRWLRARLDWYRFLLLYPVGLIGLWLWLCSHFACRLLGHDWDETVRLVWHGDDPPTTEPTGEYVCGRCWTWRRK